MREVMRTPFEGGLLAKMLQGKCHFIPVKGCPDTAQSIDHDDHGHMCAARTHTCGAPCDLQLDGKPLCTRECVADWQVYEIPLRH